MNIKAIFQPRKLFLSLAKEGYLRFIPDKTFLRILYYCVFGRKLNLKNPVGFNEKMQWLKLYDRNALYTQMVDKYEVREYISSKIGEQYLIPLLGVWNRFDEIDFATLPDQFVLKCTHDSGGLVICRDKKEFDFQQAREKLTRCLKQNFYYKNREWPYKNVKPRIIAEKYMEDKKCLSGLIDYKFFCFNGTPEFLYISEGLENHETAQISFVNLDYTQAPFQREDFKPFDVLPPKPDHLEEMINIAQLLAKDIIFVRVDLYEIDNRIYFSELTFTPCSGFLPFKPRQFDEILGQKIKLPKSI